MSRSLAVDLAESLEVVNRERRLWENLAFRIRGAYAGQVDHRVQQHGGVAVREHETVAVRPQRIFRVIAQELLPEGVRGRRQRHGRPWVPGVCLLDAVHRERADCVDTE